MRQLVGWRGRARGWAMLIPVFVAALAFSGCPLLEGVDDDTTEGSDLHCEPDCEGVECGSDGCGGSCGGCSGGMVCNYAGQCVEEGECEADCSDKQCGNDGCGGSCGTCSEGVCTSDGQCTVGSALITGSLSFEVLWPRLDNDGKLFLDQEAVFPAGGMLAILYDGNDKELAAAEVAYDGTFAIPLPYDAPKGNETVIFSTLWAPDSGNGDVVLAVLKAGSGAQLGSNDLPPWVWSIEVSGSGELGDITVTREQGSGAMFIYLFMRSAMEAILYDILAGDASQLETLAVMWNDGKTWSCGSCFGRSIGQTVSGSFGMDQSIFIGGDPSYSSAWGYPVILHEFGHYTAANYSRDDSPGGPHDGSPEIPPFAWSEGWASFSSVANVSRWYGAPYPLFWDKQQGFTYWIDYSDASVYGIMPLQLPSASGGIKQDLAEDVVASMLWNVWDGGDVPEAPGSEDGVGLGTAAVLKAISSSRFIHGDRGYKGADLVDFLDAAICANSGVAGGIESVMDAYGFPYDNNPTCK